MNRIISRYINSNKDKEFLEIDLRVPAVGKTLDPHKISGHFLVQHKGNRTYVGELRSGKYDGSGLLLISESQYYLGDFSSGRLEGFGSYYNGWYDLRNDVQSWVLSYSGSWCGNLPDGFGRLFYPSGKIRYEGEWRSGEPTDGHEYDEFGNGILSVEKKLEVSFDVDLNDYEDPYIQRKIESLINEKERKKAEIEKNKALWTREEEGAPKLVEHLEYERSSKNRRAAIEIHGYRCKACGFDFYENYGELGQCYIEIHHLRPVSHGPEQYSAKDDLVPLCSNCHAMIHRLYFVEDPLKELLKIVGFQRIKIVKSEQSNI